MKINFRSKTLQKLCSTSKGAVRALGPKRGNKLMQRMNELAAFNCLADVPKFPPARCHQLGDNRKGQFSVDLEHPYRLIFVPDHNPIPELEDGGINLQEITKIKIIEIVDTHDKKGKKKRGK